MPCLVQYSQDKFVDLVNAFAELVNIWSISASYYKSIIIDIKECIKLIDHIHKHHLHQLTHNTSDVPSKTGIKSSCSNINVIDRLLREISSQFDLDDNKLVYGDDFIFTVQDDLVPRSIKATQTQSEVEFGLMKDQFKSVAEYLNGFNLKQRCIPQVFYNTIQPLILQAILEENPNNINSKYFNKKTDKQTSCFNLIYGVNFIIDPDDPNKPKELIELEKTLNIPIDIDKMSYDEYYKKCIQPTLKKEIEKLEELSAELTEEEKREAASCGYVCTRLVGEWLHQVDLDHNGLIYGTDFILSNYEPKKCRCLKELEEDVDWNPSPNAPYIYWDDFCNTFPDKNPDDRYKS